MNEREQLARIKKLGVSNFETIKKVRRLQTDMLARLERSSVDPDRYAGLDDCRADYCGRVNCLEACPFGALNRRLSDVPAALRLFQNAQPPFHEVRVSRALWY
jgi:ferredoxin